MTNEEGAARQDRPKSTSVAAESIRGGVEVWGRPRMPDWYVRMCKVQSRAYFRGQLTDAEWTTGLDVWHPIALAELDGSREEAT